MHALGTGYARKSGEPLGFRPKEGTCASTGAQPPSMTRTSRWRLSALPVLPRAALLGATTQVYRDVSRLPSSSEEPLPVRHSGNASGKHTYDFSSCFFPKFKKSAKRGFSREINYSFGFYGPKIGGGGFLLPSFCPQISKALKVGLFWGICACSGLVLQNSAAHQCTCL